MSLLRFAFVLIIQGILANETTRTSYKGFQVWKIDGNISDDNMSKFQNKSRDMWENENNTFTFLLNENESGYWEEYLKTQNVSHRVLLSDVQAKIDELMNPLMRRAGPVEKIVNWSKQPTLAEINLFLKNITADNPSFCSLKSIGKTLHKKDIYLFKISNGNKINKAILVDAGFHGREWTGVLAALYFIDNIVKNYTNQPDSVTNVDWYILPLMNPDGYEYSITTDRLWRKNRRRFSGPCYGVDLNRNFDYRWSGKGASLDICSQYYCGPDPFSEEETKAFRNLVLGKRFLSYISLHSTGTKVLYPWNFDGGPTFDFHTHQAVTKAIAAAMRAVAHGQYTNGNIQKMGVERGAGLSIDWMYFNQNIPNSYLIETRGRVGLDLLDWHEVGISVREIKAGLLKLAELCYHKK